VSTDRAVLHAFNDRRVAIRALGCKVSRIEAVAAAAACGTPAGPAEIVVVQTCTVTDRADRDGRKLLRRIRRESPGAVLVVTGCLAQRDPEGLARMPEVDLVVGHARSGDLAELLDLRDAGLLPAKIAWTPAGPGPAARGVLAAHLDPDRTRAFVKVQDGCSRRCAFCVVPAVRGPERSAPVSEVESEIRRLARLGVTEVVVAGVHLAAFGAEKGESLLALLDRLESDPPGCRVRLSSLEPMGAGEPLVARIAVSTVAVPHLHLPLQSGSDGVLRRMRRGLTTGRYRRLSRAALAANPRLHLATDLIAGFPGETEAEHEETLRLVEELPFATLHVFPFSPRSGTRGAELHREAPVPPTVVTRRAAALRRLGDEKARLFRARADGTVADTVALRGGRGLTDHYLEVPFAGPAPDPGTRLRARLSLRGDGELEARPAPSC